MSGWVTCFTHMVDGVKAIMNIYIFFKQLNNELWEVSLSFRVG